MFPNLRLLFLGFFIVVQEINYPSWFSFKQKKSVASLVDTSENNAKTFVGTAGESLYPVGGTGWNMDIVRNHSKPTSIGQKYSHCLANYSKSVVIGSSGRKLRGNYWQSYIKGSLSIEVSSFVLVEFWLEFIQAWSSSLTCHGGRQDFDL